ncbi:MAG: hypothetical protein HN886_04845 [Woeseiaceae bacterium]|nr:hypothetical protein [Woeseiaceae bacterium]
MIDEIRIVIIVYLSALMPIYLLFFKFKHHSKYEWLYSIYIFSFFICVIGWEIWFNYGLYDGYNVEERRSPFLNGVLPMNINWLLNSLADAGTICLGGILLLIMISRYDERIFLKWNWNYFCILMLFTLSQNIFVEMFLYFDQISIGKPMSWAPFSPFGNTLNPELLFINGRSIMLQTQLPWLIMTPILYAYAIISYKRIYRSND